MTKRGAEHERVYRGLLRLYPAEFRAQFSTEMVQLFGDQLRDARTRGPAGPALTWLRAVGDVAVTAASEHLRRNRTVAHSLTIGPSTSSRLLGLIGTLGGLGLIAVFIIEIGPELNVLRLILFNAGAMSIVIGVHRRQASVAPRLALAVAIPAVLANAWYLAMTALAAGRTGPIGAGDFGLVYDVAAASMWLADAAFGLVALRLGVFTRWGALALGIGSLLAITGMSRLELTSADNPTIIGALALVGIALNGVGWILLGIDLATRRRAPAGQPPEVRPGEGGV